MSFLRKYGFLVAVLLINLLMLVLSPQREISALTFTGTNLMNFLFMLTPIFICIGLLDVWLEKEQMIRIMGAKSGVKGALLSLALGIVTAVPIYALLPVAGILLKKGSRLANVLLFLCSSAAIRIPLILFEVSTLGWPFAGARLLLNIGVVFAIAYSIDKSLTTEEKRQIYKNTEKN